MKQPRFCTPVGVGKWLPWDRRGQRLLHSACVSWKEKFTASSAVTTVSVDVQVNLTVSLDCGNRFPLPLLLKSKLSNQQHRKKYTSATFWGSTQNWYGCKKGGDETKVLRSQHKISLPQRTREEGTSSALVSLDSSRETEPQLSTGTAEFKTLGAQRHWSNGNMGRTVAPKHHAALGSGGKTPSLQRQLGATGRGTVQSHPK